MPAWWGCKHVDAQYYYQGRTGLLGVNGRMLTVGPPHKNSPKLVVLHLSILGAENKYQRREA